MRPTRPPSLLLAGALLAPALAAALAPLPSRAAPPDPAEEVRRRRGEVQVLEKKATTDPRVALTAAAELARAGGSLDALLFERGWPTGPSVRAATQDGAEPAARAIATRLFLRGGAGYALATSRHVELEHARAKAAGDRVAGAPRDFFEQSRLLVFARAAGLPAAPKDLRPVCLVAGPDGTFDMSAAAWGLLACVRLAQELGLERRVEGGQTYVGATAEEGFEALLLLYAASATLQTLRSQVALGQGGLGEASVADYDPFTAPRYYPHVLKAAKTFEQDGEQVFAVVDATSRLGDQAALLLGACEYARLRDAAGSTEAPGLVGPLRGAGDVKEDLFPAAGCALAKDLAKFIFRNIAALHFDPAAKAFVSSAKPGERGKSIDTGEAALALLALDAAHELFADDAKLRAEVKKLLVAQAAFVESRLQADGRLPAATVAGAPSKENATLAAEGLAVQALLAAWRASGEAKLRDAARRSMRALEARRYDPWASLYLETDPAAAAVVGPDETALVLGALRDLALTAKAPEALDRFREVWGACEKAGAFEGGEAATLRVKVSRP
jgi:hypothetical protein